MPMLVVCRFAKVGGCGVGTCCLFCEILRRELATISKGKVVAYR